MNGHLHPQIDGLYDKVLLRLFFFFRAGDCV